MQYPIPAQTTLDSIITQRSGGIIMRSLALLLTTILLGAGTPRFAYTQPRPSMPESASVPDLAGLPRYDHVVIVVEENKDYDEVIGDAAAPYINTVLKAEGANFTRMYGEEHYSQGNYFWLFSGSNQSVGFRDQMPTTLFTSRNLGEQLITKCRPTQPYLGSRSLGTRARAGAGNPLNWPRFDVSRSGNSSDA
jgi:hypothetical protein